MRIILILLLLFTACEKEVSVSQIEPEIPMGSIFLSTYPEGMKIFIDGKNSGFITPDTIGHLTPGSHEVLFRKDLFLDYSEQILITENKTTTLFTDFRNVPGVNGSIKVGSTNNGTAIELNNVLTNLVTPATISGLFPGYYKVKGYTFECRPDSEIVAVKSGKQSLVHLTPEDTSIWVRYTSENSVLPSSFLGGITHDGQGGFWIESSDLGLIGYDKHQIFYPINQHPQLPSNGIIKMLFDSKNSLWISSTGGVTKFDGITVEKFSSANTALKDNTILDIAEGPDGNLWFSTLEGVTVFDGEDWFSYDQSNSSLSFHYNISLAVSSENTVLIGTNGAGFIQLKNGEMRRFVKTNSMLEGNTILRIVADKEGGFYVSVAHKPKQEDIGGLFYFKDGIFKKIDYAVLKDNVVNSMLIDSDNTLWLSTNTGIMRYNKADDLIIYNKFNTPLIGDIFNECLQDSDGNLWFTSVEDGLIKLKVHKLQF